MQDTVTTAPRPTSPRTTRVDRRAQTAGRERLDGAKLDPAGRSRWIEAFFLAEATADLDRQARSAR